MARLKVAAGKVDVLAEAPAIYPAVLAVLR
jgi:hypothetical protein